MKSDEAVRSGRAGPLSKFVRRMPNIGLLAASGTLIGLGALALARGLHLYVHFYSYATGIATSRLYQTLVWAAAGGVLLSIGVFLLANSLFSDSVA